MPSTGSTTANSARRGRKRWRSTPSPAPPARRIGKSRSLRGSKSTSRKADGAAEAAPEEAEGGPATGRHRSRRGRAAASSGREAEAGHLDQPLPLVPDPQRGRRSRRSARTCPQRSPRRPPARLLAAPLAGPRRAEDRARMTRPRAIFTLAMLGIVLLLAALAIGGALGAGSTQHTCETIHWQGRQCEALRSGRSSAP